VTADEFYVDEHVKQEYVKQRQQRASLNQRNPSTENSALLAGLPCVGPRS